MRAMPCMLQPDPARPIGRRERCLPARSRLGYVRAIHPPLHIDRMRMRLCAVFFLCSALVRVRVVCTIIFFPSSLAHTLLPPHSALLCYLIPARHACGSDLCGVQPQGAPAPFCVNGPERSRGCGTDTTAERG